MPHALVVDDSRTMRVVLTRALTELGWRVTAVPDSSTALAALAGDPALDVVVVDVVLPGMSGVDLVRHVRARSAVPVLVVTADSGTDGVLQALEAGADEYLMKPFTPDALASKLVLLREPQAA